MTTPQYGYVPSPFSRRKTWVLAHKGVTALIAAAGLTAGVVGAKVATRNSGPPTFLATSSSQVGLIQWTGSGYIQGTFTDDSTSGTPPDAVINSQRASFTGQINGSSVTLNFSALFVTSTIYGSLNGGILTLNFPQNNGTIQPSIFVASDLGSFNTDVTTLQRRISHANVVAEQAQQQAAQQQKRQQDFQTAQNDIASLQHDTGNFSGDLSTMANDVKQASKDLGVVQADAAKGKGSYCNNVYNAGDDAYTVDDDTATVGDDVYSLTDDIHTVRQDMAAVNSDLQTIANDGGAVPPGARSALAAAESALKQAKATANGYIDQVNATDSQAFAVANGMATGSCSGQGPGNPSSLVPHIH